MVKINTGNPSEVFVKNAGTYGIMATAAITNTGNSVINDDVSHDPGTSMTGFPPGEVNGTVNINNTESAQARQDLYYHVMNKELKTIQTGNGQKYRFLTCKSVIYVRYSYQPVTNRSGNSVLCTCENSFTPIPYEGEYRKQYEHI